MKETGIHFKAYTAASPSRKWEGEIIPVQLSEEPYEVEINARGSCFHVLTGHHQHGRYICIPNWNVGTEMASYKDVFWNREHLVQYTKLDEKTDSEQSSPNNEPVIMVKHYEMSDGTWKTDEYTYQYRLEITGRMNNAVKDSTFIFLSNIEDITFDQAWKAAGFSSNMDDYFDVEDAKFVGFGGNTVVQDIDYSEDTYIYEDTDADTEEMEIESTEFIPTEN